MSELLQRRQSWDAAIHISVLIKVEDTPLVMEGAGLWEAHVCCVGTDGHFQMVPGTRGFLAGTCATGWGGRWGSQPPVMLQESDNWPPPTHMAD